MFARTATLGALCIVIAAAVTGTVLYRLQSHDRAIVFSQNDLLSRLWHGYAQDNIEPGTGRVLDKQRDNITTSEGEGYAMLRSVWVDDQATFDLTWKWTQDNLQRKDDKLFAWLFGKRNNGSYGVLADQGGMNTATDGDTDIALSLIFAYQRWHDPAYLTAAQAIVNDIWKHDTVVVHGQRIVVADNLEQASPSGVLVNPSYFEPYAYRAFAVIDKDHDWQGVVNSSYDLIDRSISAKLDKGSTANLPPDWILVDRASGNIHAPITPGLTTTYGFEAIRLPWRLALDWQWNKEPRAQAALAKMSFLADQWKANQRIAATYAHDGSSPAGYESIAAYAGSLGYFTVIDAEQGKQVYASKLEGIVDTDTQSWKQPLGYYDDNWAWFGIGLYNDLLPNLTPQS